MSIIPNPIKHTFDIGDGREITLETGRLARQANGSVLVTQGDCAILATVCSTKEPRPGQSFFPLSVDYRENFFAAGRIPGSFFKREGRISDYEILVSRLVDRALRPLFPDDYYCDVQIQISLISSDEKVLPDALACLAASAALAVSDVPITEIISEVRVALIDGEYVLNPSHETLENAKLDFIVAGTMDNIMMVEGEAKECDEEEMIQAIFKAHEYVKIQIKAQEELRNLVGNPEKADYPTLYDNPEIFEKLKAFASDGIYQAASANLSKHDRSNKFSELKEQFIETLPEDTPEEDLALVSKYFYKLEKEIVRNMMLDEKKRLDGRKYDEVRPLTLETNPLATPHGSALFTRGETQALGTITLGSKDDEMMQETAQYSNYEKVYLQYKFPPFSTGEVRPMRGPSRREVGHGNLALRSLIQTLPNSADFPYTIRIVSDVLESNGSSSMATVCAGSMALMDAAVPYPKHVAGVAMGMISRDTDKKYCVITDILGDEDHLGDMDFKVAGTRDGITGIQMDIKIDGLSVEIMREALEQAKAGRMHILDAMYECIPEPRSEFKPQVPRIELIVIDKEFIGAIIGKGGEVIQELQRETDTNINIEEVGDTGEVTIFSNNAEGIAKVREFIKQVTAVPEVGKTYMGKVVSIKDFGAFVEFMPGKQGLLHISEYDWARTEDLSKHIKEGDEFEVKLKGLDPKTGKVKLSRKELIPRPERNS